MSDTAEYNLDDDLDLFDLTCPGCGSNLLEDIGYVDWRICSTCNRHFWISARERVQILSRDAVFTEIGYDEPLIDALESHHRLTPADRRGDLRDRPALADALITGHLTLPHASAVVAVMDPVLLPNGIGLVAADKLIGAFKTAIDDRAPVVVFCGGGSLPAGTGLLTGAQALRIAGAIAELHRAGLALVAVLTHPSGGNLLSAIGINADIRIAEPGTDIPPDVEPDEVLDRPAMLSRLEAILRTQGEPDPSFALSLAGSPDGLSVRMRTLGASPVIAVMLDTDLPHGDGSLRAIRRGQRIAAHLELPMVLTLTGVTPLALQAQLDIRDLLLRHRRPTIGVLAGDVAISNLNVLAVDTILGQSDLALREGKARPYPAAEAVSSGVLDGVIETADEQPVVRAIEGSLRLSPARRFERRLRSIERRGAESSGARETSAIELMDLKEMQANFMRSVEDFRQRLETREFSLPTLANLQGKPHLPQLHLPKFQMSRPDLIEMRDKWMARRKPTTSTSEGDEPA